MSQVGRKAGPVPPGPARRRPGPGTFDDVAGFRIGRGGRDNRTPQGQQAPQGPSYGRGQGPAQPGGPSYGQPPYGRPGPSGRPSGPSHGYPSAPQPPYPPQGQQQGQPGRQAYGYPGPADDGPEYFGDGGYPDSGPGGQGGHGGYDPYAANNPGHTQAFSVDEAAGYTQGSTYHAGSAAAPAGPVGPPLHWKELLKGIVLSPDQTFLRMRDYTMWAPALVVTFLYGLLAVFGFDGARADAINATLSNAVPIVLVTAVVMVIGLFVLGVVTHSLARQLGGDGAWQPTVGLSMLITALTDAPRLIFAMFFGGDAGFVQILGWATWIGAGALLTLMVSRSHDLPWPKALGASAIQLVALLSIVKLGTF
ncbi:YIP1 family protein [Streptomyces sp. NPDC015171]|uniref:YIP1 family protein n=1 Tax=Streptomyces sp. NPDC015171 TaxID=3364945 RepID=UPI0036F7FD43